MVVAPLVVDLGLIVGCLVALGILLLAFLLTKALFGIADSVLGWLPWVGGKLKGPLAKIEQRVNNAMSSAINGTQGVVGAFWHAAGNMLTSIGHEIHALAVWGLRAQNYIDGVVRPWVLHAIAEALKHGVKWLRKEIAATKTTVYRVTKVIEHPEHTKIGGAVRRITRPLKAEVAHLERWTRTQLGVLERDVTVWIPGQLRRLGGEVGSIRRSLRNLRAWVRQHERSLGASAAVAALTFALARIGAGWLRCRNWRKVGRSVCRMDAGLLDDLLAGSLLVVGGISIVEFAKELQTIMGDAESGIRGFIRETR